VFHPLGREHIRKIVDIQLAKVHKLLGHNKIKLHVSDSVKDWLAARGYHVSYGARPLKRLIQTEITNKLATILLSRTTDGPAQYDVQVSKDGEALNFIEVFDNAEAWSGG
jgi:ATP-dependent Clp protease ATP-binding subunit ClpB